MPNRAGPAPEFGKSGYFSWLRISCFPHDRTIDGHLTVWHFISFVLFFPHKCWPSGGRDAVVCDIRPLACRCSTAAHYFCACWLTATRHVFLSKNIYLEVAYLQPPPPPPPSLSRAAPAYRSDDDDDNNNIILHFNDITIMCYRPVSYPKRVSILNIIIICFY